MIKIDVVQYKNSILFNFNFFKSRFFKHHSYIKKCTTNAGCHLFFNEYEILQYEPWRVWQFIRVVNDRSVRV